MSYTGNIRADWDTAPAGTRSWWVNLANTLTDQARPPFTLPGWSALRYTGYQLYNHNMHYQRLLTGSYDSAIVTLVDNTSFSAPPISVPLDTINLVQLGDWRIVVPEQAFDYPRATVNACRHYWTGISRHRRNLP